MKDSERQWKTMKDNERQWKTMKGNERQKRLSSMRYMFFLKKCQNTPFPEFQSMMSGMLINEMCLCNENHSFADLPYVKRTKN